MNPGQTFTLTPNKFDADSDFDFSTGGRVTFHTSCSVVRSCTLRSLARWHELTAVSCHEQPLVAGDIFSPLEVVDFRDETGRTADSGCSTPACFETNAACTSAGVQPCDLCCDTGPTLTSGSENLILPKDFCVTCTNNLLPVAVFAELEAWLARGGDMVCASNVPGGGIEVTASLTSAQIQTAICADTDYCPDVNVDFTCREICVDTMDSTGTATNTITTTSEFQIGFNDVSDCPVVTSNPGNNACGCGGSNSQQSVDKPDFVELIYEGGAPVANVQPNGKGGSVGASVTCTSANIRCYNNKDSSETFFGSTAVTLGSSFVINSDGNAETECIITCGGATQTVDIHTSCSQPLFTGQDFGALVVGNFPGQCNLPPPPPPPPCPLCCVDMPTMTDPADQEFPKVDQCSGNTLPSATQTAVYGYVSGLTCQLQSSTGCDPSQRIQATFNGNVIGTWDSTLAETMEAFIERMLCTAEQTMTNPSPGECPEVIFDISCCDPCREDTTPFTGLDTGVLCVVEQFTLSIVDRELPVLHDATNEQVECDLTDLSGIEAAWRAWRTGVTCTDTQSPGDTWTFSDPELTRNGIFGGPFFNNPPSSGPITELVCNSGLASASRNIRWDCTDECDNTVSRDISFTVRDTAPPQIVTPAAPATANCTDFQTALTNFINTNGGAVAQDCHAFTWSVSPPGVTSLTDFQGTCPWTRSFTFTATDDCNGKSSTTTATFTVQDTQPPVITCPGSNCNPFQIECGDEVALSAWLARNGDLACNDDCGTVTWETPRVTNTFESPPGTDFCPTLTAYEFTCVDSCGNRASRRLNVSSMDTEPPVMVIQPTDVSVECNGVGSINDRLSFERMWAPGLSGGKRWANDACHPNPTCAPDYRSTGYCSFCVNTYDPVCGNGQTYPNSCYAYCNGCVSFHPGPCGGGPPTSPPSTGAPVTAAPVTGAPVTPAPVTVPPPSHAPYNPDACNHCSSDNNPVCVGGNQQYENVCHAYCHGHYHFTVGTCYSANDVGMYGQLTCEQQCGMWQGKVCGANGVTYNSPCAAACDNVYVYHAGPCAEQCGVNPLTYNFTILPGQVQHPGQCSVEPYEFSATDPCNNVVTAGARFIITDSTPPVMTPAQDVTVECSGTPTTFPRDDPRFLDWLRRQGGATANDACAGFIPVPPEIPQLGNVSDFGWQVPVIVGTIMPAEFAPWVMNGPMGLCGTDSVTDKCVTVTFTVRDNCGNDGSVNGGSGGPTTTVGTTAKFVVVDRSPPTLQILEITTDVCIESHPSQNKAIRWANCQDNVPGPAAPGPAPAPCPFLGPLAVLNAHDSCEVPLVTTSLAGGTSLTIPIDRPDSQNPLFSVLPPHVPSNWIGLAPTDLPYDVYHLLKQRGIPLDDKCPRVSILDITVSDVMGQGETRQAYHVYVDNTPPVFITPPQDTTIACNANSADNIRDFNNWLDTLGGGSCHDDCLLFGPVQTGIVGYRPTLPDPSTSCPDGTRVTFFCEDFCGNRIEHSAIFKVIDNTPPTITVDPDSLTVECGPFRDLQRQHQRFVTRSEANAVITDNCCAYPDVHATVGDLTLSPGFPAGCENYEASSALTAQDKCGNYATKELTFFVRDTLAPIFTTPGTPLEYPCDPSCTNANAIVQRLFEMWIANDVNGCLEADDCQEDMSWQVISGMPSDTSSLCGTSGQVEFEVTDACGNRNVTTVTYDFPTGPPPPPPSPPPPCSCDTITTRRPSQVSFLVTGGAPTGLTLQNNKGGAVGTTIPATCAAVTVECHDNKSPGTSFLNSVTVSTGTVITVNTNEATETECTVSGCGGSQTIDIHTSCSQDLFTGQSFGALQVDSFPGQCGAISPPPPSPPQECPTDFLDTVDVCVCIPRPAPPPPPGPPICQDRNRPSQITALYIGGNQLTQDQEGKASVQGGTPTGPATITCQNQQVGSNVNIGQTVVINTNQATETVCTVVSGGQSQRIEIHTSCSKALNIGDIFGSIQLVCAGVGCSGTGVGGGLVGCPPPPSPPSPPPLVPCGCGGSGNNQLSGRPNAVALQVVAGGPLGLSLQNNKGGSTGSAIPANCASVSVECHNNKDAGESFLSLTTVALGGTVTTFPQGNTEMECTVTCASTGAVQTVDIHTSCSQPLFAGQNFGALTVVSFPGECGSVNPSPTFPPFVFPPNFAPPPSFTPGPPPAVCNACEGVSNRVWAEDYYTEDAPQAKSSGGSKPKLSAVTVRYIQGFALTNTQEGKATVVPQSPVSGPANVQCAGTVAQLQPGGEMTFFVSGSESVCTVFTASGTQTITIHTSCSKDINVGDIYGSLAITRLVRTDGVSIGESQFCPVAGSPTPAPQPAPTNPPPTGSRPTNPPPHYNPPPYAAPPSPTFGCVYNSVCQALSTNGGKLQMLRFRFAAGNAGHWNHAQHSWGQGIFQPYSGSVSGEIRIKVAGVAWYVRDGQVFEVRASDLGRNKLPNKLNILIGTGPTKAQLRISTNCRYDLSVGDVFGVLEVVGYATNRDTCSASSYRTLAAVQPLAAGTASSGSSGSGAAAVAAIAVGAVIVVVLVIGVYRVSNGPTGSVMMDKVSSMASSEHGARPADLAWDMSETREPNSLRAGRLAKRDTQDMESASRRSARS